MTRAGGPHSRVDLPFIPQEDWRAKAVCAEPDYMVQALWDDKRDGQTEAEKDRRDRHRLAKSICNSLCPVRRECSDGVDWKTDEGIRGGHKIPSLDNHRTHVESEMLRLLRKGWTLDQAARSVGRPPPMEETA